MRLALLIALVTLIGSTAPPTESQQLRIVSQTGVEILDVADGHHMLTLAGPQVVIELSDSASLRLNDLDRASVSGQIDSETDRLVFRGSYEVNVLEGDEVQGRLRVRDATLVMGRFVEGEGWDGLADL